MKNWKTTSTGLVMIVGSITSLYFAYKNNALNEGVITGSCTAFLGGVGLLFSKDYNVTGGTVANIPNDASVVKDTTTIDK